MNPGQLRQFVIRPTLIHLGLDSLAAEELLLGTAAQESGCGQWIVQQGGGPALGVWQMEPATHDDIWGNFLRFQPELTTLVSMLVFAEFPKSTQLVGNLYYACAMARLQYYRSPRAMPPAGDLAAQAAFYKAVYNTPAGAATEAEYVKNAKGVLV